MLRRAGLILLLLMTLAPTPSAGQEWARKMFQKTSHDFGSVARGAKAEYEFLLSNIYIEDVHIASVRSSCGCTQPRIKKRLLKTYEQGAIVAALNTRAFSGRRGATITVTLDKPFPAEVRLHVKTYIRSDVVLNPGSVRLGTVDQGMAADQAVSVHYAGRSDWKILGVKSPNPHISSQAFETRRSYGNVGYRLLVHLDNTSPPGYVNDRLLLITNDPRSRQIPLLVEGRVVPGITVSPSTLFMGAVEPGQKVTKQLLVRGKKPFRILSITCEDDSFEFATTPGGTAKPVHLIPVTFVARGDSGKVSRTIRIETDYGEAVPDLAAHAVVLSP